MLEQLHWCSVHVGWDATTLRQWCGKPTAQLTHDRRPCFAFRSYAESLHGERFARWVVACLDEQNKVADVYGLSCLPSVEDCYER